jgi:molecular chaperone GrpE
MWRRTMKKQRSQEPSDPGEVDPRMDEGEEPAVGPPEDEDELTRLTREREEYLESWRRARADYQNLRRRVQADIDDAVRRSRTSLLSELLLVLDFLEMALRTEVHSEDARNLKIGIEMTRGQMMQFLEQQDVRPVPEGGRFDPTVHQAVEMVEAPEHEPGEVVETVRRGYRIGEHVLRHAHVKVAAEPGAAQAEGGAAEPSPEDETD